MNGRTIIVTGAGRGIGRAIARRFGASRANVVAVARNEQELDETRRMVERAGSRCLAVRADVSRTDDVDRVMEEAVEAFARIDGLVNNAGVAALSPIDALEPEQFDALVAGNIRSVFLCCRAVWPSLRESGGGVIVNVSSLAADDPFPGFAAYGATKAFVNTFSRALHAEGAPVGIRVYCVAPGAVDTQMLRGPFPDYPAERTLEPEDVAALIESLFAPAARHIGGQPIRVQRA